MTDDPSVAPVFDRHESSRRPIRTPKTAELVARKLRRMIVDGELCDGDRLPREAELMGHFSVSRPTLREAVRVLEAERLVEVQRGSRSGARVCVPDYEIVARPASLLLELSGTTVSDVFVAREAIEPVAARLLAKNGIDDAFNELQRIVDEDVSSAYAAGELGIASAKFHLRMVQLSGNATLALIAGMLYEIYERHTSTVARKRMVIDVDTAEANYQLLLRSMHRLIKLLRARDERAAFEHWSKHMVASRAMTLSGSEETPVRDILD